MDWLTIVGIIVVIAVISVAVWYFFFRESYSSEVFNNVWTSQLDVNGKPLVQYKVFGKPSGNMVKIVTISSMSYATLETLEIKELTADRLVLNLKDARSPYTMTKVSDGKWKWGDEQSILFEKLTPTFPFKVTVPLNGEFIIDKVDGGYKVSNAKGTTREVV